LIEREQRLERTLREQASERTTEQHGDVLRRFATVARDHQTALEGYLARIATDATTSSAQEQQESGTRIPALAAA
jgi:hypothetical protein